jgi:hypothetical protein
MLVRQRKVIDKLRSTWVHKKDVGTGWMQVGLNQMEEVFETIDRLEAMVEYCKNKHKGDNWT